MATNEIDVEGEGSYCPHFQHALELVGRRWTGSILMAVGDRALRFSEIRSEIPGLSDRLLDTRLTELESEGILERCKNDGEIRYSATEKGVGLRPAFHAIGKWSHEFPVWDGKNDLPGRRRC